jgi:CBS domain containing-hemolysin-like protein
VALVALMRRFEGGAAEAPHLAAEELSDLVELAGREGAIAEHERRLVQEAVDLAELRVSQIMTPRVDVKACEDSWPASRLVLLAAETGHGRFPVYRGTVDEVVGVADVFDALQEPTRPLGELARPAKFVPEQMAATALLAIFRAEKIGCAIVSDEFGGTAGLVTLEDIVEEVVGDIRGPHERLKPPPVQRLSATSYLLDGDLPAEPWIEAMGLEAGDLGVERLGGLVTALLGRMPSEGDSVRRGGFTFSVRRMRRHRVKELLLELESPEAAGGVRDQLGGAAAGPDSGSGGL